MRLFLNEHNIVIECRLFTRWQPLIAKDQEQINGSCLSIRLFSVCEKKTLLYYLQDVRLCSVITF
jgi:hypothetical protein